MKQLFILLVFIGFISCSESMPEEINKEEEDATINLEDFKWLEGMWVDNSTFGFRNVTYLEDWEYFADSLSGRGLSVENGDTILTEQFAIRIINDRLMYVAHPVNESVIGFPLIEQKAGELMFENKAHDFPQRITYQKRDGDSLIIVLSGIVLPQGDRTMKFRLKRSSL